MEINVKRIKGSTKENVRTLYIKKDYAVFMSCSSGSCVVNIDANTYTIKSRDFMVIYPYSSSFIGEITENFEGHFLYMHKSYLEEIIFNHISEMMGIFNSVQQNYVNHLSEEDFQFLLNSFEYTESCLQQKKQRFFKDIIHHHITSEVLWLFSIMPSENKSFNHIKSRQEAIVEKFLGTLKNNFYHEHKVEFYAESQYITSKYLSTVVKSVTGKTVREWINKFVTLEAKMLLKSTSKTIQQIAFELNFPNQSFFGKYFKKNTNLTPSEYRRKYPELRQI